MRCVDRAVWLRGTMEYVPLEFASAEFLILAVSALLTSMLSAVLGMGGGMTLLGIMLLFYEPMIGIPLHGPSSSSQIVPVPWFNGNISSGT